MAPPCSMPLHSDYAMGPSNPTFSSTDNKPTSPKTEVEGNVGGTEVPTAFSLSDANVDDDNAEAPSVVIYMLDPFSFASDSLDLGRLTTLGLLRCYHQMLSLLSETAQLNVSLQLVSMDSVLQLGKDFNGAHRTDSMRSLALNVFSQCKKMPMHPSNVKSLTGFGPAAASDTFLKAKDVSLTSNLTPTNPN